MTFCKDNLNKPVWEEQSMVLFHLQNIPKTA